MEGRDGVFGNALNFIEKNIAEQEQQEQQEQDEAKAKDKETGKAKELKPKGGGKDTGKLEPIKGAKENKEELEEDSINEKDTPKGLRAKAKKADKEATKFRNKDDKAGAKKAANQAKDLRKQADKLEKDLAKAEKDKAKAKAKAKAKKESTSEGIVPEEGKDDEPKKIQKLTEDDISKGVKDLVKQTKTALDNGEYEIASDLVARLSQIKAALPSEVEEEAPEAPPEHEAEELGAAEDPMESKKKVERITKIEESTRSRVGIVNQDGSIESIYVHFDGDPEGVGATLKDHYTEEGKIRELMELGDVSSLGPEIGSKHDFEKPPEGETNAYGRDRGEQNVGSTTVESDGAFIKLAGETDANYAYLFMDGEWQEVLKSSRESIEGVEGEKEDSFIMDDRLQEMIDTALDVGGGFSEELSEAKKDPKAKVRNRGDCVFQSTNAKVTDDKDHFPLNTEAQARNALARANQYKKVPKWYKGSLDSLVKAVAKAVKKKYKDIDVSKASETPGKG